MNPNNSSAQFQHFGRSDAARAAGVATQLAGSFNEDGGSFSMEHLAKGQVVSAGELHPEGGYMVSHAGTEKVTGIPVGADEVAKHVAAHGVTDKDVYEGGWGNEGKMYLDRSQRHAPTPEGLVAAKASGHQSGQIAAYGLGGTPGMEHAPEWGQDVRLHTENFGKNDVDPAHRPSGNPGVLGRNEYAHPQGDITGPGVSGTHRGEPVTLNTVLDTINGNRAQRERDTQRAARRPAKKTFQQKG